MGIHCSVSSQAWSLESDFQGTWTSLEHSQGQICAETPTEERIERNKVFFGFVVPFFSLGSLKRPILLLCSSFRPFFFLFSLHAGYMPYVCRRQRTIPPCPSSCMASNGLHAIDQFALVLALGEAVRLGAGDVTIKL